MDPGINPKVFKRLQIKFLEIIRRGFDDDLVLVVILVPVRILAVATIGGSATGLNIGRGPVFGANGPEKGSRMESARSYFHIVRLHENAALVCPKRLQRQHKILKRQ